MREEGVQNVPGKDVVGKILMMKHLPVDPRMVRITNDSVSMGRKKGAAHRNGE